MGDDIKVDGLMTSKLMGIGKRSIHQIGVWQEISVFHSGPFLQTDM